MGRTESQKKYVKRAYKRFTIEFNRNTEGDILEFLESATNKQGLVKRLLREEMEKKIQNNSKKPSAQPKGYGIIYL